METTVMPIEEVSTTHLGDYKNNTNSSVRFFIGVLVVTGILLVAIGIHDYRAQRSVDDLKDRYLQIEQYRSQIINFDEKMTMSARMAAATGDIKWEGRYREDEPKLSAVMKRAMTILPEIYRQETDRTQIGKIKLLDMENRAFNLIHQGRVKAAMGILLGEQYELQKKYYTQSIEHLNVLLKRQMDAAISVENSKEYLAQVAFITVFILLLLSWLAILCIARATQEALVESNHRLDDLNKTLDQKVQERTRVLQNVQSQLMQSEKFSAIGQLAAGVAHEINNPIGFINSNLQTLEKYVASYASLVPILNKLEETLKERNQEKILQIMSHWEKIKNETNFDYIENDIGSLIKESKDGTESMRKIVADLCAFASPDKGSEDPVDLEALMESMLNIVWNEIKYKAQVKKDYSKLPSVICNPQKIGQVFINLLTNAAHSIETRGLITIRTYLNEEFACVDISDTGCGIPPENVTKVFDPFFSTQPVGRGVGLGLSVSYDIVRRHGGVLIFSTNAHKGTTFTMKLPMVQKERIL